MYCKNKMTNRILLALIILNLHVQAGIAQQEAEEERFSFGNISPVILAKDGLEVTATSNLTSYWVTSQFGKVVLDRYRITRSENYLNLNYGFSESRRWDLGVQVRYSRLRLDENARNSPFKVFGSADATGIGYQAVSSVGLRVRTIPFENLPELTLQGAVHFPVAKEQVTRSFLGAERIQPELTATYLKNLSPDFYLYLQGRYLLQIANEDNDRTTHFPGLSVFLVKSFLDQKLYIFPGLSWLGAYEQNYKGGRLVSEAQFVMISLGAQIQPLSYLGVFLNAQRPLYYQSGISFYSDLVKSSYSDWSLGLRFIL